MRANFVLSTAGNTEEGKKDIISSLSLPSSKRETLETDNTVLGQAPCEKKVYGGHDHIGAVYSDLTGQG